MLGDLDRRILEILSKQLLITKGELLSHLNRDGSDGTDVSIQRLSSMGYIEKVESLGVCYVITQKGMRLLKNL